jgi:predicted dehydrogenase
VCHFVDLCVFLVGDPPVRVFARALGRDPDTDDSIAATLGFSDGSIATIDYLANASTQLPKERFEVSGDGRTARCENFRTTVITGNKGIKTLNQDKGQATAVTEIVAAARAGDASPFSLAELRAVSRTSFAILESVRTGHDIELDRDEPA